MWLASVAWRAARSTRATTRSPGLAAPSLDASTTTAWSSPARSTSATRARQSPSSHSIDAGVGDLAAALGVERRLGELDERAAALLQDARDRRALLEVLVAGELGRLLARAGGRPPARRRRAPARPRPPTSARAARPSARRSPAMSTGTPRSAAISRVRSIGKPKVSCSRKASSPRDLAAARAGRRAAPGPVSSVRPKPSSSARDPLAGSCRARAAAPGRRRPSSPCTTSTYLGRNPARCRAGGPAGSRGA